MGRLNRLARVPRLVLALGVAGATFGIVTAVRGDPGLEGHDPRLLPVREREHAEGHAARGRYGHR